MLLILAVQGFMTQAQTERLVDGVITFILALLVSLSGFIAYKVAVMRDAQKQQYKKQDDKDEVSDERIRELVTRALAHVEVVSGGMRELREKGVVRHELPPVDLPQQRRDNPSLAGEMPVSDDPLGEAFADYKGETQWA
jgi:hypothetical protein